jgi:hypothetical protein
MKGGVRITRRGDRVADRAALEMLCTARYRGFESRPLRHFDNLAFADEHLGVSRKFGRGQVQKRRSELGLT